MRRRGGFTLAEVLVAMGLFSIVVTIASGGFVSALRTQRQIVGLLAVNSNMSLVLEQMNREIRTGFDFCVNGQLCPSSSELSFRNSRRAAVTYRLRDGAIERREGSGSFEKITAENISVRLLSFRLLGQAEDDGYVPRVTVSLGVSAKEPGISESITNLQATVSARTPDT